MVAAPIVSSDEDSQRERDRAEEALWAALGLRSGDVVGGKYELRRRLGRGGMGAVFEAINLSIRRPVAIKVMRAELAMDPVHAARFKREARAAAEVRHPAIVDILDFGVHEGRPFIVMELLDGETLREHVLRLGWLPPARAIALLDPALRALAAAHAKGVIHRDIKPDNIFLATVEGEDELAVKVLDFGIAKVESGDDSRLTVSRMALGTAGYMAPEQVRAAGDVGASVDQYAAAVVLFEVLTGRLPHDASSYNEMIITKVTEPPARLRQLRPDLPTALEDVVMRALAPDPAERFGSIDAFRSALAPFESLAASAAEGSPIDPLGETMGGEPSRAAAAAAPTPAVPPSVSQPSTDGVSAGRASWRSLSLALAGLLGVAAVAAGWVAWGQPDEAPGAPEPPSVDALPAVLEVEVESQVTHNSGTVPVRGAALSADGQLMAYVDADGLHIRNLRDGTVDDLPTDPGDFAWAVAWMPESLRVLVTARRDNHERILALSILGREPRWELVRERALWPAVSPDGERIAFYHSEGIGLMRPDGSTLVPDVVPIDDDATVSQPVWSADGRWLAWLQIPGDEASEIVAAEIGDDHRLAGPLVRVSEPRIAVEDCNPLWLPSGHLVYSVSAFLGEESRSELRARTLDRDARQWSEVIDVPACRTDHCYSVSASADGRRMLIEVWRERVDLATFDLTERPGRVQTLLDRDATEIASAWTNDGREVLLSSNEAGHYRAYRFLPGATRPEPIVRSATMSMWATAAPDGTSTLFWQMSEDDDDHVRFTLVRAPLDGSAAPVPLGEIGGEDLLSDLYTDFAPILPPYSQRVACRVGAGCLLSRGEGEELVFYALDPDDGSVEERARLRYPWSTRAYTWRLGTGERVVLLSHAYAEEFRIELLDLESGALSPVPMPDGCDPDSAELDDAGALYVACRGSGRRPWSLHRVAPSGEAELIWESEGGAEIRQPLLSPDGETLLFTYCPSDSNVFLLDATN